MKKVIPLALTGLALLIGGIGLAILYLLVKIDNILLLIGGTVVSLIGIVVLYKAGRIDVFTIKFKDVNASSGESMIEKNNKMVADYNKTADARDKLKILQMSSEAQSGK